MGIYIRKDKKGGKIYYSLVESHREGKKVVQTRIKSLGTTPPSPETRELLIKQHTKLQPPESKSKGVKS